MEFNITTFSISIPSWRSIRLHLDGRVLKINTVDTKKFGGGGGKDWKEKRIFCLFNI